MPAYTPPTFSTPAFTASGGRVSQFSLSTVGSTGLLASPAAGQTITWLQVPQDGVYSVQLQWGFGTAVAALQANTRKNNVRLQIGNITVTSLLMLAATSAVQVATVILALPSEQFIGLNVITEDTGAEYLGQILATKL